MFLRNMDGSDSESPGRSAESDEETSQQGTSRDVHTDPTLRAANGSIWSREPNNHGHEGRQKVFNAQQGFRRGLHPNSRFESLQTV